MKKLILVLFAFTSCHDFNNPNDYTLGETGPAGGLVFSIGWHHLEAAPQSTEWTDICWSGSRVVTNANRTAVGTGEQNTKDIIARLGARSTYAARLCDDLTYGGYSDWFLPSIAELNLMRANLYQKGLGGFVDSVYWSSSEYNKTYAWLLSFSEGVQYSIPKSRHYRVRAVRAFWDEL